MQALQLFDPASSTYTYILHDPQTGEALIIDPVDTQLARDLALLAERQWALRYVVETHAHADHITSAAALAEHTGAQTATPAACDIRPSAIQLQHGDRLHFGSETLTALHTPGHTAGSMSYCWRNHVFTGDTLLIGGCGRTDFQSGSADALYDSLTRVLFALPDDTLVWPGHDYHGQTHSTIGHEKQHNPRINEQPGLLRSRDAFIALMNSLNLPKPQRINEALPANLSLGVRHDAGAHAKDGVQPPQQAGYAGDVYPRLAWQWWRSAQATLVDVRTDAERAWVGFIPEAAAVEWKHWPGMALNPDFDKQLQALAPKDKPLLLLCRSGVRSIAAAQRATQLGYTAYNVLEGFEGDANSDAHRGHLGGWRHHGLPWRQS